MTTILGGAILLLLAAASFSQFTPVTIPLDPIYSPTSPEFQGLEGKKADPCARFTTAALPDCQTLPDSSVTVLIPSETSVNEQTGTVIQSVRAKTYLLVINGLRFSATFTGGSVAVGSASRGCVIDNPTDINAVLTVTDTTISFAIPDAWMVGSRELEDRPRPLCIQPAAGGGFFYTGFKIGTVWNCELINGVSTCGNLPPSTVLPIFQSLSAEQVRQRANRGTCCKGSTTGNMNIGQCIFGPSQNANAPQACCGDAAMEVATETCCTPTQSTVTGALNGGRTQYNTAPCWCSRLDTRCPAGQSCCLPTKFPELVTKANPSVPTETVNSVPNAPGECFNPSTHLCCDTGMRYDPGAQQCCPINGVQSQNVPCPCADDTHCRFTSQGVQILQLRCCSQVNSTITESRLDQCNTYANFPSGTGPYQAQRCPGNCFDPTYQICCNGVQCIMAYEKCCNSTCCNRFTQTCSIARHSGTPGNRYNFNEFNVKYDTCSTTENLNPPKIAYPIVLPIFCLMMSLMCTALCLVFANKASSRSYAAIEKTMIYLAVLCNVFDIILYFSPAWKYGLFILFVQCFTILSSAARVKWLNIWSLALGAALAIYLVDPFHGNSYLTLASSRTTTYFPNRDSAGLIHVIGNMWKDSVNGPAFCTTYYLNYFSRDPQLRDYDRYDNPAIKTFGFCDRAYVLVLLVFCSLIYICVLLQLLLNLLALLLRFNKSPSKLISHEE